MNEKQRFNLYWAIGVTIVGFGVIAAAVYGDYTGWYRDVWYDLLIEFGAGIALVAIIVYFERHLTIQESNQLERMFEQQQREIFDRIDKLDVSIASLNSRIANGRRDQYAAPNDVGRKIEERPSTQSVVQALQAAIELNTVADILYVQASPDRRGLRLGVVSGPEPEGRSPEELVVELYIPGEGALQDSPSPASVARTARFRWKPEQSPEAFILMLEQELQKRNRYEPGVLDAETFFTNLRRTLDVAVGFRRSDLHASELFSGRLVEAYDEHWFITTNELVCVESEFRQPADSILHEDLPVPDFVAAETWRFLTDLTTGLLGNHLERGRQSIEPEQSARD